MSALLREDRRYLMPQILKALVVATIASLTYLVDDGLGEATQRGATPSVPFCQARLAHDYERPFDRMPPKRSVPSSGQLPFTPGGTELSQITKPVMVGGGEFGYSLSVETEGSVGWVVKTRLLLITARGRVKDVLGRKDRRIAPRDLRRALPISFGYEIGARPAFYLYEISFESASGKRLAQYGQYVRVMPAKVKIDFVSNAEKYLPGTTAYFRIENVGTSPIGLNSEDYVVERVQDGQWSKDPASPQAFTRTRLGFLTAGEIGFCRGFKVPTGLSPGSYRFRKDVTVGAAGKVKRLTASFSVESSG